MKNSLNIFKTLFVAIAFLVVGCEEETYEFGEIIPPSNIQVSAAIQGADEANPYGDGSGVVNYTATGDDAISYKFIYNGSETVAPSGEHTYSFSTTGIETYTVTAVAIGTGGITSSVSINTEVLVTYEPPADLLEKLFGDGEKTWRIKSEVGGHFGLGPVGGLIPTEWWSAGAGEKSATGMYDDRYIFNIDGTFTHITNYLNGDDTGTIFGRERPLEADLGPTDEEPNGADIENYPYNDYTETMTISAPGGVETISLTGFGFIGYYTGGNHQYMIMDRGVPGELLIKTTDDISEFDWWFIITDEEPSGD